MLSVHAYSQVVVAAWRRTRRFGGGNVGHGMHTCALLREGVHTLAPMNRSPGWHASAVQATHCPLCAKYPGLHRQAHDWAVLLPPLTKVLSCA